jgi:hypothetical protein
MKFVSYLCALVLFCVSCSDCFAQKAGCENTLVLYSQFMSPLGSTYVPMDSWIYPALSRLYGLGYVDTAYLGLRPWTRWSIVNMLMASADKISHEGNDSEACGIYRSLEEEFAPDVELWNGDRVHADAGDCGDSAAR